MFRHLNKINALLGLDIGGSHASAAIVDIANGAVLQNSYLKKGMDPAGSAEQLIKTWLQLIIESLSQLPIVVNGIGIAMPGPFDYDNGISFIQGLHKYESLYGINIKKALQAGLDTLIPMHFENDASCFGLGECHGGLGKGHKKVVAITLGTGLGAAFIDNGEVLARGEGVPPGAVLYPLPFKDGIAEDFISARWLLNEFKRKTGIVCPDVRELAGIAVKDRNQTAISLFTDFGNHIGNLLADYIIPFNADCLVLGGGIANAADLFVPSLANELSRHKIKVPIKISASTEFSAIRGAAFLASKKQSKTA